jgi:dephospho-CoA kinase
MMTIGLAGSMCTGKSVVLDILAGLGCFVAQADLIARDLMFAEGSILHPTLVELYGADISTADGKIDMNKLRLMIFNDEIKRKQIIELVTPLEREERRKLANRAAALAAYPFFVYESAYLVESGEYRDFDRLIVTYTSRKEHIERLMERGMPQAEAKLFIKKQTPLEDKLNVAHFSIDTSGTFAKTRTSALAIFEELKKL